MRQIALGMVVLLFGSGPALAGQCEANKMKAAATKTVRVANCVAKAVNKGTPIDLQTSPCVIAADEKFAKNIAKAEAKGPCDVPGNIDTIRSDIAFFIIDLTLVGLPDPGPSKCEASKWKATAKKVKAKLGCRATAEVKGGPVGSVCLGKAEDQFMKSFTKADLKAPCTGDPVAIETAVDFLLGVVKGALDLCSVPGTPNGTPCDDRVACTDSGFCLNGVCESPVPNCPQQNCILSACDFDTGECVSTQKQCPPVPGQNQDCFERHCDSNTDGCISIYSPPPTDPSCTPNECNTAADCLDNDPCTTAECDNSPGIGNSCSWFRLDCNDGIPCTIDYCDPTVGCEHRPADPITFCDDHASCTDDDYASYPASCDCTHTPHDERCDDNNACTDDVCNPGPGSDPVTGCRHQSICP